MRSKERFIEETGGFRFGESPEQFHMRVAAIQALDQKEKSGKMLTEGERKLRNELKGLPPDEFDFEETDSY